MLPSYRVLVLFAAPLWVCGTASAQRHSGAAPPTAPHPTTQRGGAASQPITPVSSGLGSLQFVSVNYGVPAPQSLTRQLQDNDDRTRAAALSAIGAPREYLVRGHIPLPRSLQLNFTALSTSDEVDAILTVQLDQHMVSAILLPEDGSWRRIATVIDPSSFDDSTTTPSNFLQVARSILQQDRYRAVYHASASGPHGDFVENEAQLRILNNHAVITLSFASSVRTCDPTQRTGCLVTRRWVQYDGSDPTHRLVLITGTGRLSQRESADPLARSRSFETTHLRAFTCQPFQYSAATEHFEPATRTVPCVSQ